MKAEVLLASGMHQLHWYAVPLPSPLVQLLGSKKKKKLIQSWYFFLEITVWDQGCMSSLFGLFKRLRLKQNPALLSQCFKKMR